MHEHRDFRPGNDFLRLTAQQRPRQAALAVRSDENHVAFFLFRRGQNHIRRKITGEVDQLVRDFRRLGGFLDNPQIKFGGLADRRGMLIDVPYPTGRRLL